MKTNYATIPDRVKASLFDVVLLIVVLYLISQVLSSINNAPIIVRSSLFIFVVFIYEPLFVSLFGGTIGHSRMNISVKSQKDENKNIHFMQALIRYLVKVSLGWISLLTIGSSEKRTAIHDTIVNSVVISMEENNSN